VNHRASSRFWDAYGKLPADTQAQADKQFTLLKQNPRHPSLQFKKVGKLWSARVSSSVRALAVESESDFIWFWIGDHQEYERLIATLRKR
jgi:hypothetical protein